MSSRRLAIAWAVMLAMGCGSAAPEPETATGTPSTRDDGCGATCEAVDLRGPIAAASLGEDAVAVAARAADGTPLLGVARIVDGRWDARSLRLRPLDVASGGAGLALVDDADGAVLAVGTGSGIVLYRVESDGDTNELGEVEADAAARVTLLALDDGWAVGWLDSAGIPHVSALDGAGDVRPLEAGVGSDAAHDLSLGLSADGSVVARSAVGEIGEVELAGSRLGRSGPSGVAIDGEVIDDGTRDGEPAHRVGAALALLATGDEWVAAYQDQTAGALVVTTSASAERLVEASPDHTRGMHVALVQVGGHVFVLDLGARSGPAIQMLPFVTPVALR